MWELDQRLGSSFHEEFLPPIRVAAAQEAPASGSTRQPAAASPADLLQAAQDRASLLRRAYDTITDLQTDVDACLAELDAGAAAGARRGSPLPFPALTPAGEGHTAISVCASGATPHSSSDAAQAPHQQAQQHPPPQPAASHASSGSPAAGVGASGGAAPLSEPGCSTPPEQRLPPALAAQPPEALSPDTAAFVSAAFSAREAEAATAAALPRPVLNTNLADAAAETGRCVAPGCFACTSWPHARQAPTCTACPAGWRLCAATWSGRRPARPWRTRLGRLATTWRRSLSSLLLGQSVLRRRQAAQQQLQLPPLPLPPWASQPPGRPPLQLLQPRLASWCLGLGRCLCNQPAFLRSLGPQVASSSFMRSRRLLQAAAPRTLRCSLRARQLRWRGRPSCQALPAQLWGGMPAWRHWQRSCLRSRRGSQLAAFRAHF